jgi:hypothetical protein
VARPPADDDVPRLPRGRGLSFSFGQIMRIAMVAMALVALLVLQRPCARSVSKFVTGFGPDDAGVPPPRTTEPVMVPRGVPMRADMTPAEIEAARRKAIELAAEDARDAGAAIDAGVASDASSAP